MIGNEKLNTASEEENASSNEKAISRREFLKLAGLSLGALAFSKPLEYVESISDQTDNSFDSVSKSYLADTHEEASKVSEAIKMERGASPSNICGPLATSILMGWKLNPDGSMGNMSDNSTNDIRMEGITPKEMWLGSPENTPERFSMVFPKELYDSYRVAESIGYLDFDNIPGAGKLKPGDFLYLDGGSFTHYIAVSRRDKDGKIFCVSNIPGERKDEFVIKEVMLWDPYTKDGYLRNWAKGVGPEKARTGLKGFYLWRRRVPAEHIVEDTLASELRDSLLNDMRNQKQGEWNMYVHEMGKGDIFEWRDEVPYHSASTIKMPLSILAIEAIKARYGEEISLYGLEHVLHNRGIGGRSFDQVLTAMLRNSEEVATENIAQYIKQYINLKEGFRKLNMYKSSYEPRRTTQKDLFRCWKFLFSNSTLDNESREYLISKLGEYTSNDDILIGEIRKKFTGARQWNKRGTIMSGVYTVQDSGVIEIPTVSGNRYFYISIAGISKEGKTISYEEMLSFISKLTDKISVYIQESNKSLRKPLEKRNSQSHREELY